MRITDGTSQADRFPMALQSGYIQADEMRFEDLLALGADYSYLLKFIDRHNRPGQSWAPFFTADALVLFARILAMDLQKIEAAFTEEFLKEPRLLGPYRASLHIYDELAVRIDGWFKGFQTIDSEAGQKLLGVIQSVIQNELKRPLHELARYRGLSLIQQGFEDIWFFPEEDETQGEEKEEGGQGDDEYFVKTNFRAFFNAALFIRESARKLMPDALESQIHNPAIGMYVAFIRLYQRVQRRLNQFTARHLDFYYRDVLQIQPQPGKPDKVHLTFDTDVAAREVLIEAGTEFTAGTDEDNNAIIYTADNDLLVNNARVKSLYTLFLERDPLIHPEKDLEFATGAKIDQIPVREAGGLTREEEPQSWPIFGAHRSARRKHAVENAHLGLALASPVLGLKEGQRKIEISFNIELAGSAGFKTLDEFISKLISIPESHDQPAGLQMDATEADIFYRVFRRMFAIQLTADNGWYEVADYLPIYKTAGEPCAEDGLCLRVMLSPQAPPIVPYVPELHGDGYDTDQPLIRFTANPTAYLYPYSLLKKIVIKAVGIRVDVNGVKDLVIHNHLGPLDAHSPFHPFGPLPTVGAYLIFGSREIAAKPLTRLEAEVEWADLPAEKDGFQAYYRAYGMDFNDAVFEAALDVLSDGKWQPGVAGDAPRIRLFESVADGIARFRRLPCREAVPYFRPRAEVTTAGDYGYDPFQKDGFFRLTLAAPLYAFGHRDYPLKLARVLTENARLKKLRLHRPVPNPPYTPRINRLSLNYTAHERFNFEKSAAAEESQRRGGINHIHPWGVERLSPLTHPSITMVPAYNADGNLFIGLWPPGFAGTLTLLFNLREDSTLPSDADPPKLTWHCLVANRWQRLENRQVLSDTTNGFLTSGIVTLQIPARPGSTSSTMPGDLFWLRVSIERNPERPCSVYAVHAQALGVTRQKQDGAAAGTATLPAGTIKDSRVSIAGIDRIVQSADAFGGRQPEAADQVTTRVSERLRHKNRATVAWDYERLILNRFPQIYKVKCFANMADNPRDLHRPGHILIAVIPFRQDAAEANMRPMAPGVLLKQIEDYVRGLCSPFVALKVRNPAYEKIQIRCRVQFKPGKAGGYYHRKLNQALVDYLSPWHAAGYQAEFGWCVRRQDIKSYIRNLDYVQFVTDFSMLRVTEGDDGKYTLFDTARREPSGADGDASHSADEAPQVKAIHPFYPWSIAIPFKQHYIEVSTKAEIKYPSATGINELEIGSNFIVSGKGSDASQM